MTAEKGVYCDLAGLRNPSSRIQEVERLVHEFLDGVIPRTENFVGDDTELRNAKLRILDRILFCRIDDDDSMDVDECFAEMRRKGPRQVCQYQFRKNDIVWICKSCQQDDTCVQCNECFMDADHTGHEVFFYHSQAGGCCDCGDSSSWATGGFCKKHGNISEDPLESVSEDVKSITSKMISVMVERIVNFCVTHVEQHNITPKLKDNTVDSTIFNIFLYNDDVHTFDEVITALQHAEDLGVKDSAQAQEFADLVHESGHVVLKQGSFDELYESARYLSSSAGLKVALIRNETLKEREAILLCLQWMYKIAQTSDGLSRLVCNALSIDHLVDLLKSDPFIDKAFAQTLHNLYLTLMADQTFKLSLARAYALSFTKFAEHYSNGIGVQETNIFSLSVQFLNRPSIVQEIVGKYSFLISIIDSLDNLLDMCHNEIKHSILNNRRYNPIFGDLKLIFTIPGISRWFFCLCSTKWFSILGKFQYMHRQKRSLIYHVEFEQVNEWVNAFNLYLGFSLLFDYLVNWVENPDSINSQQNDGEFSLRLPSAYEFLVQIQYAMFDWQNNRGYTPSQNEWNVIACLPDGGASMHLPPFPEELSFHLCIHRFMANSIRDICKFEGHVSTLDKLRNDLSKDPINVCLAIDYPLINIVWASQIKVGMWKKNGQVMKDQLLNYAEAPLCRSFRDLDLLLIQFYALGVNSNVLLNHIFARYQIFRHFLGFESPIDFADDIYLVHLMEEALIFLIQLLSEIPSVPISQSESMSVLVKSQLRKEIVHRLVSGPKTYSQLQKCLTLVPDFDRCESSLLDQILDEVAVVREPSSTLDPHSLVLNEEVWDDYDPTFVHIPANCHQDALENRPRVKSPKPMVKKFNPVHPTFRGLQESILGESLLHRYLKGMICLFASKRSSSEKYVHYQKFATVFINESLYSRTIHVITLMVHTLRGAKNMASGEDDNKSSYSSIANFFESNVRAESCSQEGTTVFEALIDIFDTYTDGEENQKMWHQWIFQNCNEMIRGCKTIYESRFSTATQSNNDKKVSQEARKKLARERAMKAMKSGATAFASHVKAEMEELEMEDACESDLPQCIVCQESSHEIFDDPIGYLGYSQASTVLGHQTEVSEGFSPPRDPSEQKVPKKDLYFQTCGHAMHLRCFDDYFATVVHRSDLQMGLILDTHRGQFQCPLCKRLNNLLLPYCPTIKYAAKETKFEADWLLTRRKENDSKQHDPTKDRKEISSLMNISSDAKEQMMRMRKSFGNLINKLGISLNSDTEKEKLPESPGAASEGGGGVDESQPVPSSDAHLSVDGNRFYRRFLSQFCEPVMGENDVVFKSNVELLKKVNMVIKAITFGCTIEAVENYFPCESEKGLIASCSSGDTSDLQLLLDTTAVCVKHLELRSVLEQCLFVSLRGDSAKEVLMSYLDVQSSESISEADEICWIAEDFLTKPLLETLILGILLERSVHSEEEIKSSDKEKGDNVVNGESLINLFRWVCVGRLVQLILKDISEQMLEKLSNDDNVNSKRSRLDDRNPLTTSGDKMMLAFNSLVQRILQVGFSGHYKTTIREDRVFKILHTWCLFIRNAATIMHKCRPGLISSYPMKADDNLIQILQSNDPTNLSSCLDDVSNFVLRNFGANMNLFSENAIVECCKSIDIWMKAVPCDNSFLAKVILTVSTDYYAIAQKPHLKPLPDSYTKLHGLVVGVCDYEYPAICMVCGQILNSGGNKDCTNHAKFCCPEGGVFFLLQDCTILLMYDSRASYFSSPYTDSYGEKHRQFKGRPLHLDKKRNEIIRKFWVTHSIPREVVKNRSSTNRLIRLGHY